MKYVPWLPSRWLEYVGVMVYVMADLIISTDIISVFMYKTMKCLSLYGLDLVREFQAWLLLCL